MVLTAPSRGGRARLVARSCVALTAALLVVALSLRQLAVPTWRWFIDFAPMTLSLIVGSVVVLARPKNVAAWALFAISVVSIIENVGYAYGLYPAQFSIGDLPAAFEMVLLALALQSAKWIFIPLIFLAFPDGSLARRRIPMTGAAMAVPVAATLLVLLNPDAAYGPFEVAWRTSARELGVLEIGRVLWGGFQVAMVLLILWVFQRARRGGTVVRQQAKWLAVGLVPLLLWEATIAVFVSDATPQVYWVISTLVRLLAAVAVGMAVTRYRLFDVDRLLARTVLYGSMAGVIAVVYAAVVGGAGAVAGTRSTTPAVAMAASMAAALVLLPLHSRLRRMANVLVFGRRATPYESMSTFSQALGRSLRADEVLPSVADAVIAGTGATWVTVTVFTPVGREEVERGQRTAGPSETIEVRVGSELVGTISAGKEPDDVWAPIEHELLGDLAAQAGPAFHSVALDAQLEDRLRQLTEQAAELRRSRERIVAAKDDERRRIERDLHDGVQQQLVSLAGQLRLLTKLLDSRPAEARALAERLALEASATLEHIRDVARGLFPQILATTGLAGAVRVHVAKVPVRVDLVVDPEVSGLRLDQRSELATYFCVLEALQNVTKHAGGAPAVVTLTRTDDTFRFTVADQGPGFDQSAVQVGVGFSSMEDRLAAIGGNLEVSTTKGGGTVVMGSVPLTTVGSENPSTVQPRVGPPPATSGA